MSEEEGAPTASGAEVVVVFCQGCLSVRPDPKQSDCELDGVRVRLVPMPCTSRVQLPHLLRLLERGVDGVQVIGCPTSACRFLVGSRLAEKRIQRARELLEVVGLGAERVGLERGAGLGPDALHAAALRRAAAVRELGPSPMKEREP